MLYTSAIPKKQMSDSKRADVFEKNAILFGDILLGADIEYLFFKKNKESWEFVGADNWFSKRGMIGTDGRSIIGEMRVTPAQDPVKLAENVFYAFVLMKSFFNVVGTTRVFPFGLESYHLINEEGIKVPESIGMHMHFGLSKSGATFTEVEIRNSISALDILLAPIIKRFEHPLCFHIRTNCGYYGDLSDVRIKPHGFEYRSLPCFLDNPMIFLGAFSLAKAIVFDVRSGRLNRRVLSKFSIKKELIDDQGYLKVLTLQSKLFCKRSLLMYPFFESLINPLYEAALSPSPIDYFKTGKSLFDSWGIDDSVELPKEIETIIDKLISGTNISRINPASPIFGYDSSYPLSKTFGKVTQKEKMVIGPSARGD